MDWQKLIQELQADGMSQADIGERIGRSQAWVSAAVSGKYQDVRWADGKALLDLYSEVFGHEFPAPNMTKEAA